MPKSTLEVPFEGEYRKWLGRTYSGRLLGDWLSRTRRVLKLVDLSGANTVNDVDIALLQSLDVKKLSNEVRSQMKKAGHMYVEFRNQKK